VDVQVSHHQERDARVWEEGFRRDGVDPAVRRVDRVGIDEPEGVETGAKHRFLGRDVEGHNVDPLCKPWQYRKTSKKRTMYLECHPELPDWWKKGHKATERRKSGLTSRRVLKEDHRGVCARLFERLK